MGNASDAEDMARLAEAVVSRRMNPSGALESTSPYWTSLVVETFRRRARDTVPVAPGSFREFLRWYFAPPDRRADFPGAPSWTSRVSDGNKGDTIRVGR